MIQTERQIIDRFLDVTVEIPQIPDGAADIGAYMLELEAEHGYPWEQALTDTLDGDRLEYAIDVTDGIHTRLGLHSNRAGLAVSLPFASELVRGVLASTFPSDEAHGRIPEVTPELAERSSAFMQNPENRRFALSALRLTAATLRTPDVQEHVGAYQNNIVQISQYYRQNPNPDNQRRAMNMQRTLVTDRIREAVTPALITLQDEAPKGVDMKMIAHNLTRWEPSDELAGKHFNPQPNA